MAANLQSKITNLYQASLVKNKLSMIFFKYQEQPTVLDCMLKDFVEPIMRFMQLYIKQAYEKKEYKIQKCVSFLFELVHNLCNIRGHKTVMKLMP